MRQKLNENPLVQAGVLGVLALIVAFLLFTRMGGSEAEPAPEATTDTAAAATAPAPAATDTATAPPAATAPFDTAPAPTDAAPAPADAAADAAAAGEFVAGPGLPASVVGAYADGKTVVLLITREKGIDDRKLREQVAGLAGSDVAVFHTHAKGIARYSRITNGVDVERTPALIVITPRSLNDGAPEATVSYGFRGPDSVRQAVRDALYKGPSNLPYHPE